MKYEETARRLRQAMADNNMKSQDIVERTGINKASISQYVNGSHKPSNITAGLIANVLSVNPLWLMGFDVDRDPVIIPNAVPGSGELLDLYFKASPEQRTAVITLLRSFVK